MGRALKDLIMGQKKVMAVDQTIVWTTLNEELRDAYSYTTTFAQAAARVRDPDPNSPAYFDTMKLEYQRLGWNVLEAEKVGFHVGRDGSIVPANVISTVLDPYLNSQQQRELQNLLSAMGTDNSINDFCSFFWSKSHAGANKQSLTFGPLVANLGQPEISCIYYTFDYRADSWRSLFIGHRSSSAFLSFYRLKMMLNMPLYYRIKDNLIARLVDKIDDHVRSIELDL
jgi:hypothetical protein